MLTGLFDVAGFRVPVLIANCSDFGIGTVEDSHPIEWHLALKGDSTLPTGTIPVIMGLSDCSGCCQLGKNLQPL